jgi:hypothetical protein
MAVRIVFMGIGLCLIMLGYDFLRQKRKIEHTPTSKIRSLAIGLVEIEGNAIPVPKDESATVLGPEPYVVLSPFTKKECIYYKYLIEEYKRSGKSGHWVTVQFNEHRPRFYVKDDTGRIIIDSRQAKLDIKTSFEEESRFGRDPSGTVMHYLKDNNIKFENFFGINKTMRYREEAIFVNEKVYVIGDAMPSGKESDVGLEKLIIGKKGRLGFYFISNKPEKDILKYFNRRIYPLFIIGGIFVFFSAISMIMEIRIL